MDQQLKKIELSIVLIILLFVLSSCKKSPVDQLYSVNDSYSDYNANRLFIKNGLQLHAWTSSEDYFTVNVNDWDLSGFGGPTFFRSPMWNPKFMAARPNSQWSLAKAPYAGNIDVGPNDQEQESGFLNNDQRSRLDDLTTMCFGDEESFDLELVANLKSWYEISHKYYPNVIVHNNQWGSQWDENDLRIYVLIAKPDIITFDAYLFGPNNSTNYRGGKQMAEYLMKYRKIALAGADGVGEQPIGFGQYIQGWRKDGSFDMTESQLRLYYYMTWAFGGKWLNWFRYLQGNDDGSGGTIPNSLCMLLENGLPGNPSQAMYWAGQCNNESKNLSDYLVRLQTTDVRLVLGDFGVSGGIPSNVALWTKDADNYIELISGEVLGNEYTGKNGDVYVGYFKAISSNEHGDPGFFTHSDATFFMMVNAFTTHNALLAQDAAQEITVYLDIGNNSSDCVKRINRVTGTIETIVLTQHGGSQYSFKVTLPGGTGDLFYIEE